jgi:uncharacterized protein YndB with AHSA1/START domain
MKMTELLVEDDYAVMSEPATLTLTRLLPGPIERVWSYLTDSNLRRQWLAAGAMEQQPGASVELVWHNDDLTDPPGQRPDGMGAEHRMTCEILQIDPPHRLRISWGSTGGVSFELEERGADVLLTLIHHRIEQHDVLLNVSAGWHAHLAILGAKLRGETPAPHWDNWTALRKEYAARLGA